MGFNMSRHKKHKLVGVYILSANNNNKTCSSVIKAEGVDEVSGIKKYKEMTVITCLHYRKQYKS